MIVTEELSNMESVFETSKMNVYRLGKARDPVDNDALQATVVQQVSTATCPSSTDLIRPKQTRELHERPVSTSMQLVHTEEVTSHRPSGDRCHAPGASARASLAVDHACE